MCIILLRRTYRNGYFARRDARVYELRQIWDALISVRFPTRRGGGKRSTNDRRDIAWMRRLRRQKNLRRCRKFFLRPAG